MDTDTTRIGSAGGHATGVARVVHMATDRAPVSASIPRTVEDGAIGYARRRRRKSEPTSDSASWPGAVWPSCSPRAHGPHGFAKVVVLERIHRHLEGVPSFVEMFLDEARLAAQLHHPNVVQIFDIGEGEHGVFYVMEYLDGRDVGRLLQSVGGRLPLQHVVTIAAAAASGLHHAHVAVDHRGHPLRVFHRDVSPANIFVTYEGAVKVVDFGIAKAASNRRKPWAACGAGSSRGSPARA